MVHVNHCRRLLYVHIDNVTHMRAATCGKGIYFIVLAGKDIYMVGKHTKNQDIVHHFDFVGMNDGDVDAAEHLPAKQVQSGRFGRLSRRLEY